MFRFIGWLVVTGFALYGVRQFVENHVVASKTDIPLCDECRPANNHV